MNNQKEFKRIEYIDALRSYGILLMIMGHIGFGEIFSKYIHSFHMPLFFIVSGYFFRKRKVGELLKKRIHTLLIPYIVFGFFHTSIFFLINRDIDIRYVYIFLFENTADKGIAISGALWFLTALFFCEIIYNFICYITSELLKNIVVIFLSVLGMILPLLLPFRLPWAIDVSLASIGLMHFGSFLGTKIGNKFLNISLFQSVLLLFIFSVLAVINPSVNLRKGEYGNYVIFYLVAIGITVSLFNIWRFICSVTKNSSSRIKEMFLSIGVNSIVYLCFNQIVIKIINRLIVYFPSVFDIGIMKILTRVIVLIVTLLVLYGLNVVFVKTPVCVLIGKTYRKKM